jgi:hypothetical protein
MMALRPSNNNDDVTIPKKEIEKKYERENLRRNNPALQAGVHLVCLHCGPVCGSTLGLFRHMRTHKSKPSC